MQLGIGTQVRSSATRDWNKCELVMTLSKAMEYWNLTNSIGCDLFSVKQKSPYHWFRILQQFGRGRIIWDWIENVCVYYFARVNSSFSGCQFARLGVTFARLLVARPLKGVLTIDLRETSCGQTFEGGSHNCYPIRSISSNNGNVSYLSNLSGGQLVQGCYQWYRKSTSEWRWKHQRRRHWRISQ